MRRIPADVIVRYGIEACSFFTQELFILNYHLGFSDRTGWFPDISFDLGGRTLLRLVELLKVLQSYCRCY